METIKHLVNYVRSCVFPSPEEKLSFWDNVTGLSFIALGYWAFFHIGFLFALPPSDISFLWPLTGLEMAILVLNLRRRWLLILPVFFIVDFFSDIAAGLPAIVSLSYSVVDIIETTIASSVFLYLCKGRITFETEREVVSLFFVSTFVIGLTGLLGASVAWFFFGNPYVMTWLTWVISDGIGIVLFAPLIVSWVSARSDFLPKMTHNRSEILFLFPAIITISVLMFGPFTVAESPLLREYLLFPLLIWLALRSTLLNMVSALSIVSVIAVYGTLHGYGLFSYAGETTMFNLLGVQPPLIVIVFSSLLLSVITNRLKEKDKLIDAYLTITMHELRTPFVPIKAQAQLLLGGDYGKLNKEQTEAVEMIYRNEENFSRLSQSVFDAAKIRSGRLTLVLADTDIGEVIRNVAVDSKYLFSQKHISFEILPLPHLPKIMADQIRIGQVVNNLLDNASKFTHEGGKVSIEVGKTKKDIVVIVKDSGIGISPQNVGKIFDPFFQVDSSLSRGARGTGLGLAICKGILEEHRGKIWVESAGDGKGSSFIFTLPMV